jgi:methylenetetrahydrofolate dehydrogenase (NADP+) / methenyltetrahydrofolate cyclohydrolase
LENILLKLDKLSDAITSELKEEIGKFNLKVRIASIILGNDPSSLSYLRGMQKKAGKIGIEVEIIEIDENISEDDFLEEIRKYNADPKYAGIIVQVPLPKHIGFFNLSNTIDYRKDLDGIHPYNQGCLFCGYPVIIPATAWAVDLALRHIEKNYNYTLQGKNAVIIGRSLTVGKPVIPLLLQRNITTTTVHTKTRNAEKIASGADIIVASSGVPEMVTEDWIKEGSVVIDVGIHSTASDDEKGYRLCGDVNAQSALKKARIVTAVPGGIGIITSSLLFANALKSHFKFSKDANMIFDFEN